MAFLRDIKYRFNGGKAGWFARRSKSLLAALPSEKTLGIEPNLWRTFVETLDVGLEVAPDQALELCVAWDAALGQTAPPPSLEPEGEALLLRAGSLASGSGWRVGWMISKRVNEIGHLKSFGVGLALQLVARDEPDALIMHLEDCRQQKILDLPLMGKVVQQFLVRRTLRGSPAWYPFLRQLPKDQLPPLFEVHALLRHALDAINLASSPAQIVEAVELCLAETELEPLRQALELAKRLPNSDLAGKVHQALGAILLARGEWAEALASFAATGDRLRQSICHEHLGDVRQALALCPTSEGNRMARLIDALTKSALETAARGDVNGSMVALMDLLGFLAKEADASSICLEWRGVLERHRSELIAAGRARLRENSVAAPGTDEYRASYLARSAFEELAGEWCEAALLLEQTRDLGDRLKASQLWEKDHRYGEAVRALGPLAERRDVQLRLAQLREKGGDSAGAASLFEHLQSWGEARRAYEAAGQPSRAANCYLEEHGKAAAAESAEYATLLITAGRIDDLLRLYLECLGRQPNNSVLVDRTRTLVRERESQIRSPTLREAAKSVERVVQVDLRQQFNTGAGQWIDQARAEVLKRYGRIWGMDLGTSKSAVALFDLQKGEPFICPHEGKPHFPSTLSLDKQGNEIVGLDVLDQLRPDLRGCIEGSKRAMGTRTTYKIGDRHFSPEEVAARLLTHGRRVVEGFLRKQLEDRVLDLAQKVLGEGCAREWLQGESWTSKTTFSAPEAMVTIPAYFNFAQRQATRDAAEIAGIKLHRLVCEPTAACLYAGLARKWDGTILVVDLGAGTLDLSYMESSHNDEGEALFEVQKIFGDSQFGSRDFDAAIEQEFVDHLKRGGMAELTGIDRRRLHAAAEQIKITLSSANHATYELVSFANRQRHTVELSAVRMEELLSTLLSRLTEACREAAGLRIDHLVLVGAPMLSPLIRQRLEALFHRKADAVVDPRTAVALGAACQGAAISNRGQVPMLLLDIVPFALGVLVKDGSNGRPAVSFHIPRGTSIPHQNRKPYTTTKDNQPAVDVEVFQGLGNSTEPEVNKRLAHFTLEGLPPAKAGDIEIEIAFDIDVNGLLEVTAKDTKTGRAKSLRVADSLWLSLSDRSDMTSRLTRSQRWATERAELASLARAVSAQIELLGELERQQSAGTWKQQFEAWQRLPSQSFDNVSAAEQTSLAEMYNGGAASCDRFVLDLDRARNLLPRCQRFVEAEGNVNFFAPDVDIEKQLLGLRELGTQIESQTRSLLAALETAESRFLRWRATMAHCATQLVNAGDRLVACHDAGDWSGTVKAFDQGFGGKSLDEVPLPSVRRKLDALARLGRRDDYRRVLTEHREPLALMDLHFDRLNEFARHVQPGIAWIFVQGLGTGSGFLAGPNLVVTNLHVVLDGDRPSTLGRIMVHVGGASRPVVGMRIPSAHGIDLVVLELDRPLDVRPMRIGFSGLVEVGERVLAIGFPLPEGSSFEENLLLDHGIVNRIRTRPELGGRDLELGLRIFPGMSGGPIFNDRGEVVGISTFARYSSADGRRGPFVDKSSHAIAVDPLYDLLPRSWLRT